jgi:hypothetical protein
MASARSICSRMIAPVIGSPARATRPTSASAAAAALGAGAQLQHVTGHHAQQPTHVLDSTARRGLGGLLAQRRLPHIGGQLLGHAVLTAALTAQLPLQLGDLLTQVRELGGLVLDQSACALDISVP